MKACRLVKYANNPEELDACIFRVKVLKEDLE